MKFRRGTGDVQGLIDETYANLRTCVCGRSQAYKKNQKEGKALATELGKYADGRVLSGSEALKYGVVE